MSQNEAAYLKAWAGTLLAVALLLGLTWLSSVILASRPVTENAGEPLPQEELPEEMSVPGAITVEGTLGCLPHKDTTGPQTLECAIGLMGDDGENYSLDLSAVTYPADTTRARVSGHFTPAEALSSDAWQKYEMRGIIRAESVEPI